MGTYIKKHKRPNKGYPDWLKDVDEELDRWFDEYLYDDDCDCEYCSGYENDPKVLNTYYKLDIDNLLKEDSGLPEHLKEKLRKYKIDTNKAL